MRWLMPALSLTVISLTASAQTPEAPPSRQQLWHSRLALLLEKELINRLPDSPYLMVDITSRIVHLKLNGRLLRTMTIEEPVVLTDERLGDPHLLTLDSPIEPASVEPGNEDVRLRGRRFPLDFRTRLLEGPRDRTRFYFVPPLVIRPAALPPQPGLSSLPLSGADIKALASALEPGSPAIFIAPLQNRPDGTPSSSVSSR